MVKDVYQHDHQMSKQPLKNVLSMLMTRTSHHTNQCC